MRAWLSPSTGTGGFITLPLDTPTTDPDTLEVQTTYEFEDSVRPLFGYSGAGFQRKVRNGYWVVFDLDAEDIPDDPAVLGLGNPFSPGWRTTLLTNQQKNSLRSVLGGRVAFWQQDMTRGQFLKKLVGPKVLTKLRGQAIGYDASGDPDLAVDP